MVNIIASFNITKHISFQCVTSLNCIQSVYGMIKLNSSQLSTLTMTSILISVSVLVTGWLRGSASPVLTATAFVNGKGQFSTPHRIDTPQPITKKFVTGDYVGDPYGCAKLGAYPYTGGFWAHGKYNQNYFCLYPFFWERTYRSDTATDFHAWWLKRRGLAQGCAFLGIFHIAPHLGGQKPPILGRE